MHKTESTILTIFFRFCVFYQILPVVVFFSSVISVLYYLGCMQATIKNIGWLLQNIMGTTPAESICAAGNVFVGMVGTVFYICFTIYSVLLLANVYKHGNYYTGGCTSRLRAH